MNKRTTRTRGVVIEVGMPYNEGDTLTAGEARALNQLRIENIRDGMKTQVDSLESQGLPTDVFQAELQKLYTEAEAAYAFSATPMRGKKVDPVERVARDIAKEQFLMTLRANGVSQKAFNDANGDDAVKLRIEELAATPAIVALAEKEVEHRRGLVPIDLNL